MRSFLPSREQIPMIVTLVIVLLLGASYYYVYLPNNERKIQEWRFRTLQNIDVNVHEKIKNSFTLLGNLLKAAPDSIRQQNREIKKFPPEHFTLDSITRFNVIKDSSFHFNPVNKTYQHLSITDEQLVLKYARSIKDSSVKISMIYTIDEFIKPLLPDSVFDQYIILDDSNNIVYETFPSGFNFAAKDTLIRAKGVGSVIRDQVIGGVSYKLFLQPVFLNSHTKWIVAGLLSGAHFQEEKSKLPPRVTLLLITIFLVILVTLPIVKLYQMGNDDRLSISDAISSIIVFMLLISLLSFLFFKYNAPFRQAGKDTKEVLANTISSAFLNEINVTRKQLIEIDRIMANDPIFQRDFYKVRNRVKTDTSVNDALNYTVFLWMKKIADVSRMYWLDTHGTEIFTWNVHTLRTISRGNFSERDYFKKLKGNREYWADTLSTSSYYVDQVTSWTSGLFLTVVSIPSKLKEGKVAAASFEMKSLDADKMLLPPGYSFAVIDKKGKVLYHSNKAKNLNENLLQEFSESENLSTCLAAGSSNTFDTNYGGQEYEVRLQAISQIPYYIVILEDLSFKNSRDIEIYTFTISMQLMLVMLLILQLLALFFASSKHSVFRNQLFDTSWVGPRKSSHYEYFLAFIFNVYIIFLLCIFPYHSFVSRFFYILFSVSVIPMFIIGLYALKYKWKGKLTYYKYKKRAIYRLAIIIFFLNITAFCILDTSILNFVLFQLACFLPGLFIIFYRKRRTSFNLKVIYYFKKFSYYQSFSLFLFSWLLITNGLSVLFFYMASYNNEHHMIARYRQFESGRDLLQKALENKDSTGSSINNLLYRDSTWIKEFGDIHDSVTFYTAGNTGKKGAFPLVYFPDNSQEKKQLEEINYSIPEYTAEDSITIKIFNSFRVFKSENAIKRHDFHILHAKDNSFFFNNIIRETSSKSGTVKTFIRLRNKPQYLTLSSANLNYRLPPLFPYTGSAFWILLIIALAVLFQLIYMLIKKLFAINLPDTTYWKRFDEAMLKDELAGRFLFMIGVPGSGKLEFIKEMIDKGVQSNGKILKYDEANPAESNVFLIDMSNIPDKDKALSAAKKWARLVSQACEKNYELIVVRHFEYNFKNQETNYFKLQFLERLLLEAKSSKIIILSTVHPVTMQDSLKESSSSDDHSVERWEVLFGYFHIVIHSISNTYGSDDKGKFPILRNETRYTHFLNRMHKPVLRVANSVSENKKNMSEESLAYKLEMASHQFYFYIWQSLSKEEKFVLYDLAEDGLVNTYDQYTVSLLINKGVIMHWDGTLKLFNKGFRNFILTGIGAREEETIQRKINDNSNWNKTKMPLALILLTIFAFLLSSQHETSTKLIASLSALAAVIPAIINFLSTLGGGNVLQKSK